MSFKDFLGKLMGKIPFSNKRFNWSRIAERVGKTESYYKLSPTDKNWGSRSRLNFLNAQDRLAVGKSFRRSSE